VLSVGDLEQAGPLLLWLLLTPADLLLFCLAAVAQMPKPAAKNMTMADDHAGHDHGDAGHDHDEPKTAQNGKAPMAQNGAAGGHSKMNMTMAKALPVPDSCVKDPKQSNCSSWDYPHANAANDLARLCGAMSFMAGGCALLLLNPLPRQPAANKRSHNNSSRRWTCA
jgi:hypothetical protein